MFLKSFLRFVVAGDIFAFRWAQRASKFRFLQKLPTPLQKVEDEVASKLRALAMIGEYSICRLDFPVEYGSELLWTATFEISRSLAPV